MVIIIISIDRLVYREFKLTRETLTQTLRQSQSLLSQGHKPYPNLFLIYRSVDVYASLFLCVLISRVRSRGHVLLPHQEMEQVPDQAGAKLRHHQSQRLQLQVEE